MFEWNFQNTLLVTAIIVVLKRIIVFMYYNMYYTVYDFPLYYENNEIIFTNTGHNNENITHMLNTINSIY
jgi:hypothetical protein